MALVGGEFSEGFRAFGGFATLTVTTPATEVSLHPLTARHYLLSTNQGDTVFRLPNLAELPSHTGLVFVVWNVGASAAVLKDPFERTIDTVAAGSRASLYVTAPMAAAADPGDVWRSVQRVAGPRVRHY